MTGQGESALAFTPTAVTGTKDGAPVSVAFDAPVFDASWSAEIAQSLPFAEGYTAAIAAYDATNGLSTVTLRGQGPADGRRRGGVGGRGRLAQRRRDVLHRPGNARDGRDAA